MKHFPLRFPLSPSLVGNLLVALALFLSPLALRAEVKLTEKEDRIVVEIDGKPFTEWRHKEWYVGYLYPVYGPFGNTVTRHYPMKEGVAGEQDDHPHHRSIRFSHQGVNGYSFWAPQVKKEGRQAEIRLEKIEKIQSGETGELVLWNHWIGDGELILKERLRLAFTPVGEGEVLIDYDVQLHAGDEPVKITDEKDGGMAIRVAGTMKVEDRKTKEGKGTMVSSRGLRNADAWGKRAEWMDYYGPDAEGNVVGIAIFDHPSNFRFPTWWHARTYGLLSANRFGTGYFEASEGAKKGDGDYTLPAGEVLELRHRLFIHRGDPESAGVAEQWKAYAAGE